MRHFPLFRFKIHRARVAQSWADQPVADLQCASAQDRRSPSKAVGPAQLETPVYRARPKLDRQGPSSRTSPPADEPRRFARFRRVRTDYRASDPFPQTPRLTLPTVIPPRYEDTHLSDLRSTGTHSHPRPPSPLPAAAPSKYRLTTHIPIRAQKSRPRNPRRPPNGYHPPRSRAVAGPHEPSKRSLFRAPGPHRGLSEIDSHVFSPNLVSPSSQLDLRSGAQLPPQPPCEPEPRKVPVTYPYHVHYSVNYHSSAARGIIPSRLHYPPTPTNDLPPHI